MIAALQKAEAFASFAKSEGAPLSTFAVALSDTEAFELLEYLASGAMGRFQNHDRFCADLEAAKELKDPWKLLGDDFQLCGIAITRSEWLN